MSESQKNPLDWLLGAALHLTVPKAFESLVWQG